VKTICTRYDAELAGAWERSRLTAKVAELTKDAGRAEERLAEHRAAARTAMEKAYAELASIQPASGIGEASKVTINEEAAVILIIQDNVRRRWEPEISKTCPSDASDEIMPIAQTSWRTLPKTRLRIVGDDPRGAGIETFRASREAGPEVITVESAVAEEPQ
jgi:hypothetical protein